MTWDVSKLDVSETTRRQNDQLPISATGSVAHPWCKNLLCSQVT